MDRKPQAQIAPGLLVRLKRNSGIKTDEAFARAIGVSRSTLVAVRDHGREPSIGFAVGVCRAFGLGMGEVVTFDRSPTITTA